MSRQKLLYLDQSDFRRGINMEPENAEPGQVLDALNVWAPDGLLQDRPGYESIGYFGTQADTVSSSGFAIVGRDGVVSTGGTAVDLNALALNDYWYVGLATLPENLVVLLFSGTLTANTATVYAQFDYWNGERWCKLNAREFGTPHGRHLVNTNFFWLSFVKPEDWATKVVASTTKYWIRIRPVPASWATVPVTATNNSDFTNPITATFYAAADQDTPYMGTAVFAKGKRYVFADTNRQAPTYSTRITRYSSVLHGGLTAGSVFLDGAPLQEPGTLAVIPEFNIAYLASAHKVYQFTFDSSTTEYATVNSEAEIVGTIDGINSPYHPDYVPQLQAFPACKYLMYAKGTLWAAGLEGKPSTVRWSGPAIDGAYNVWPEDSFAVLSEDDPIVGQAMLNEQVVIFKRDSIWLMVPVGVSDLDLPVYNPVKVVSGIGCVSMSSVKAVRGRLLFLAEDGVYAFDGTPNVQKLSGPIDAKLSTISKARRPFATAVNWSTQNCYLLSVALGGSVDNNFVFCYDYEHNAWWFWDNIPAQSWLLDEGAYDEQTLYFGDTKGRLFQFGIGHSDNGAEIESYVLTHRFGETRESLAAREIEVTATQNVNELEVTLLTDDEEGSARTIDFTSDREWHYEDSGIAYFGQSATRNLSSGAGTETVNMLVYGQDAAGTLFSLGGAKLWVTEIDINAPKVSALSVTINGFADSALTEAVSETWTISSVNDPRFYYTDDAFYKVTTVVVNSVTVDGGATSETLEIYNKDPLGYYVPPKRRARHLPIVSRRLGRSFQIKIANASKYFKMRLQKLRLGLHRLGRR